MNRVLICFSAIFLLLHATVQAQDKDSLSVHVIPYMPDCAFNAVKIKVSGKKAPYILSWSNGAVGDSVSNLGGGPFFVNIAGSDTSLPDTIIYFELNKPVCQVSAENSFTPNGDGTRDTWFISHADRYPDFLLQVYDKWGQLVHEQKHEYIPWDGTHHGIKVPEGTFYYIFFYEEKITSHHEKGSVTIIR